MPQSAEKSEGSSGVKGYMFQIELREKFWAVHSVRVEGKWESPHEHCWEVRVFFSRENLNDDMMVADFHEKKMQIRGVLDNLEGKDLNKIQETGAIPTAERIAKYIFDKLDATLTDNGVKLERVGICESPDCWAWNVA